MLAVYIIFLICLLYYFDIISLENTIEYSIFCIIILASYKQQVCKTDKIYHINYPRVDPNELAKFAQEAKYVGLAMKFEYKHIFPQMIARIDPDVKYEVIELIKITPDDPCWENSYKHGFDENGPTSAIVIKSRCGSGVSVGENPQNINVGSKPSASIKPNVYIIAMHFMQHTNALVVLHKQKQIVHFEPHIGELTSINRALKHEFAHLIDRGYEFVSISAFANKGLQSITHDSFCLSWSLFAILLIISNQTADMCELFNYYIGLKNKALIHLYELFWYLNKFSIDPEDVKLFKETLSHYITCELRINNVPNALQIANEILKKEEITRKDMAFYSTLIDVVNDRDIKN